MNLYINIYMQLGDHVRSSTNLILFLFQYSNSKYGTRPGPLQHCTCSMTTAAGAGALWASELAPVHRCAKQWPGTWRTSLNPMTGPWQVLHVPWHPMTSHHLNGWRQLNMAQDISKPYSLVLWTKSWFSLWNSLQWHVSTMQFYPVCRLGAWQTLEKLLGCRQCRWPDPSDTVSKKSPSYHGWTASGIIWDWWDWCAEISREAKVKRNFSVHLMIWQCVKTQGTHVVHIKIAGKWMFIPLKILLYNRYWSIPIFYVADVQQVHQSKLCCQKNDNLGQRVWQFLIVVTPNVCQQSLPMEMILEA